MSDQETRLLEDQEKGARANIALQELKSAFETMEKECFDTFRRSDVHDDEGRRMCSLYLRVMDDIKTKFTTAANNGEIARKELIRIKDPSRWRQMMQKK